MADHRIRMTVPWHELGSRDVQFEVFVDNEKRGELHISEGGIDWWPRAAKTHKVSLTWTQFERVMEER